MKDFDTNWSSQELQTYLFIYSMNADYKETKEELEVISSKCSEEVYKKMHAEFEKDNDYASIQKIKSSLKKLNYSKEKMNNLFEEVRELFLSDGKYEILERNLMTGLKRVLS